MMQQLEEKLNTLPGQKLQAAGASYTVEKADNFSYTDPIDGSVSNRQGLRVLFTDGSRLVYRLSGTGSSGATIRFYVDSYVPPTPENQAAGRLTAEAASELAPLVAIGLELCEMKSFTGRDTPTVIT